MMRFEIGFFLFIVFVVVCVYKNTFVRFKLIIFCYCCSFMCIMSVLCVILVLFIKIFILLNLFIVVLNSASTFFGIVTLVFIAIAFSFVVLIFLYILFVGFLFVV